MILRYVTLILKIKTIVSSFKINFDLSSNKNLITKI